MGSRAGYLRSRLAGFDSGRPLIGGPEEFMLGGKTEMIRSCSYLKGRCVAVLASLAVLWLAAPCPVWGQWNGTNPVWTNSNVGIGTTAPAERLDIGSFSALSDNYLKISNGDQNAYVAGIKLRGSYDSYGFTIKLENDGTGGARLNFVRHSASTTGISAFMIHRDTGNVGIGTTNPQYKLAVNGNIGAQDIIVTNTGWSDYVFRPGYRLRPLTEVSAFIQANHHLPDIPTEAEVKEKGVSLGDMQAKLLAKVEELTLHAIQQQKENRELRENLTRENQELRDRLARLEKGAAADSTPAVAK